MRPTSVRPHQESTYSTRGPFGILSIAKIQWFPPLVANYVWYDHTNILPWYCTTNRSCVLCCTSCSPVRPMICGFDTIHIWMENENGENRRNERKKKRIGIAWLNFSVLFNAIRSLHNAHTRSRFEIDVCRVRGADTGPHRHIGAVWSLRSHTARFMLRIKYKRLFNHLQIYIPKRGTNNRYWITFDGGANWPAAKSFLIILLPPMHGFCRCKLIWLARRRTQARLPHAHARTATMENNKFNNATK